MAFQYFIPDALDPHEGPATSDILPRCLWYIEYARQYERVAFTAARDRWGIARRTFLRDASRLRRAGYDMHVGAGSMFIRSWSAAEGSKP